MEFELQLTGADRIAAKGLNFRKQLTRTLENSLRRNVRRSLGQIKTEIRGTGLGSAIWGRKASGLSTLVSLIRVRREGDGFATGVKLSGLAKMIETGGRIARHDIEPKNASMLAFRAGGGTVFAKHVNHPGAQVGRHDIARRALERDTPAISAATQADVVALLNEVFGG
jgi:hypothetical protein